jgi:hypothetical protein
MDADHHDHHYHHIGEGGENGDGTAALLNLPPEEATDSLAIIESAIARLPDDVGAIFEPTVITALKALRDSDLAAYQRIRQRVKLANATCSVTALDRATRGSASNVAEERSALDDLVALVRARCELHHDADRNAIAVIRLSDRREVWRVKSSGFEDWLRAAYWRAYEAGVTDSTMKAALATLSAAAINDGEEIPVHVRAARWQDGYVIDLCDEHWQSVVVTASGWHVVAESPVLFTRAPAMRALPIPAHDGDIGMLWRHVNISARQRVLVLAWMIECLRPDTPFPVLELVGEQGSAKSTTQSGLRSLIDPNKVMLRGRPKTVEDIFVAAANNWMVSYENLSSLTSEQQDALCTLATGGGFAARQFYTNGEEHVLECKRPVMMNGISVVATRPDLIDRVVHIDLPRIPAEHRRDDANTQAAWEQDRSRAFGGLLDTFVQSLSALPSVHLARKQRMADFERLGEAVARVLGFSPGDFQALYAELVQAGIDRALESNAVAQALDKYITERLGPLDWQGTAGQLYDLLTIYAIADRNTWPRSPKGLADQLRRIAPAYRAKGFDIAHLGHSREGAIWRIARLRPCDESPTPTTANRFGLRYGEHRE